MKKRVAVLLCGLAVLLCTAALADVSINETNFPDMHFRGFVRKTFDLNQNGFLDNTEIKAVESITIENEETRSLMGIGFFTNLKELNCSMCKIARLDLSKNTALTKIDCSWCDKLTNIDLRGCTSLLELNCYRNQLTNLDVSHNTDLRDLSCGYNQLKNLDIRRNTKLKELSCAHNKLEKLDISHNTNLESLYCYNNQISDLDISKHLSMKYFDCSYNQLRSLNIKSNKKLEHLCCEHNYFKTLDLQNNSHLIHTLIDKPLYKIDGVKLFCYDEDDEIFLSVDDNVELIAPVAFINNVRYALKGKEAEVCHYDDYVGKKTIIPDSISCRGKKYKVTGIQRYVFSYRSNLTEIAIGKNVKRIANSAFYNCYNLKKITIKTTKLTKKTIGASSFKGIYKKAVFICPASKLKDYKKWLVKVGSAPKTCTFRE